MSLSFSAEQKTSERKQEEQEALTSSKKAVPDVIISNPNKPKPESKKPEPVPKEKDAKKMKRTKSLMDDIEESALSRILDSPPLLRALVVGCLLHIFRQASGVCIIIYFLTSIVQMAGLESTKTILEIGFGFILTSILSAILTIPLVDR